MKYLFLFVNIIILPSSVLAFLENPFARIQKDYLALTRHVTARHILLPPNSREVALVLKRKIRDQCVEKDRFIVDIFEEAAKKYSKDTSTSFRGGLLGELVPQGYCRNSILDRACFEASLGQLEGPIESEFGCHLLLVSERTNCQHMDGRNTKLIRQRESDVFGTLVPAEQVGKVDIETTAIGQAGAWLFVYTIGNLLVQLMTMDL